MPCSNLSAMSSDDFLACVEGCHVILPVNFGGNDSIFCVLDLWVQDSLLELIDGLPMVGVDVVFRIRFSNWEAMKLTVSFSDSFEELLMDDIGLVAGDWCVA